MLRPNPRRFGLSAVVALASLVGIPASGTARAEQASVAVAANFREPALAIGSAFESATAHTVRFSFGSTGQLYAQAVFGAPFDAFLSADRGRAEKAVEHGLGVTGSQFTYALGRIVLFSADEHLVQGRETLRRARFSKLAIADPAVAPYGSAAVEAMRATGVYDDIKDRIVVGLSVAQAYQFVQTGNADLGFVALSQVVGRADGSRWIVPASLHSDIRQDAVLLKRGAANRAAKAFLAFLAGPVAGAVTDRYGYGRAE